MSPLEKISQLGSSSPALPRLGLAAYEYSNEALHGIMADNVTVFPQAIALSSTWDTLLEYRIGSAISDEARALHNKTGKGLTYWAPTANMARDPRWGRTEETYGEDVFLAKKFITNFIRGMQGDDPKYLKTIATVKHFACNNVETNRTALSSIVDERSLREYYLPVFKAAVTEGRAGSIMAAYNALNGVPCCADNLLLTEILRKEWGFSGYVVSDCKAIDYICKGHHYVPSYEEAAVAAIKTGCDLCCGLTYQQYLPLALASRLWFIGKADLDTALSRIFIARTRLGDFDRPSLVPYSSLSSSSINSQSHRDLALQAARESLVLLKNEGNILPLNASALKSIAVIGPNAAVCELGGYSGVPVSSVTPLKGLQNRLSDSVGAIVKYAMGCTISGTKNPAAFDSAVSLARLSDAAIIFMGMDNRYIHEGVDLDNLELPGAQSDLIQAVFQANPKTILVLINGNPLSINWPQKNIPAIIEAWYAGQSQGAAIAEALFGDYNPGGKLTSTWVSSTKDLPNINDYSIFNNRTYMYFTGKPLYPFGYGLSYTTFSITDLQINPGTIGPGETTVISATVENTGDRDGDEVVQLYMSDKGAPAKKTIKQLKGFQRITLKAGETQTVQFPLPYEELSFWDPSLHSFRVEGGTFGVVIGNSSIDTAISGSITATAGSIPLGKRKAVEEASIARYAHNCFQFLFSDNGPHTAEVFTTDGRRIFSLKNTLAGVCRWQASTPGVYVVKVSGLDYIHTAAVVAVR
jgi:beta-glucosidase